MDVRQLGYFISIAEHGGFAAAARARYISQSALTRQVQLLEAEIGAKLLERTSRGVVLTHAGEILRARAGDLLRDITQLKQDVLAEVEAPTGRVTLCMTPSMRVALGGNLIEGFLRRYPQVRIAVLEGLSHDMAENVTRGIADVGVVIRDDAQGSGFATRSLINEPLVIAAQQRAGLRMDQPVDLAFVSRHPLIISRSNRITSGLAKEAARVGIDLNIVMDVQPLHLSIDLVCRGVAYMVVPFSAAVREYEAGFLSMAPITGFDTGWAVAWRSDRKVSAAMLKLIEAVQTEFAALKIEDSLKAALGQQQRPPSAPKVPAKSRKRG